MTDIKKQLVDIHNILYGMQVHGDSALKTATCIVALRQILTQLESEEANTETTSNIEIG